jgi:hypothetical protein
VPYGIFALAVLSSFMAAVPRSATRKFKVVQLCSLQNNMATEQEGATAIEMREGLVMSVGLHASGSAVGAPGSCASGVTGEAAASASDTVPVPDGASDVGALPSFPVAPYLTQKRVWPQEGEHILASFTPDTVIVYQAYCREIGEYAVAHKRFGGPAFSFSRMSWIKVGTTAGNPYLPQDHARAPHS